METGGRNELGYVNVALVTALLDALIDKGVLSNVEALAICDDAITSLRRGTAEAMHGAARYIEAAIRADIAKRPST